jgi:2Fe-2S ferredoxin
VSTSPNVTGSNGIGPNSTGPGVTAPAVTASGERSLRRLTTKIEGATGTFRVTFQPAGITVEAGPPDPLAHHEGQPGSILDIADSHDIHIDHSCGGFAACSTCHIYVKEGLDTCNDTSEDEEDMLDEAPGLKPNSRLSCQCVPDGTKDLVIEIPSWNRNLVGEGKH